MIGDRDKLFLAQGVSLTAAGLFDEVRGECFAINEMGRAMLEAAIGRSFREAVNVVAAHFGAPHMLVRADAMAYFQLLNQRLFVNIETPTGIITATRMLTWSKGLLLMAISLLSGLPMPTVPQLIRRRRAVDTTTIAAAFVTVARALSGYAFSIGAIAFLTASIILTVAAAPHLYASLAFGVAIALGLIVHEAAHAIALRGVPCCLCLVGVRAFLLHPPLGDCRRAAVAAVGSLATASIGLGILAFAMILQLEVLAVAGLVSAGQALALTVISADGRAAFLSNLYCIFSGDFGVSDNNHGGFVRFYDCR